MHATGDKQDMRVAGIFKQLTGHDSIVVSGSAVGFQQDSGGRYAQPFEDLGQ